MLTVVGVAVIMLSADAAPGVNSTAASCVVATPSTVAVNVTVPIFVEDTSTVYLPFSLFDTGDSVGVTVMV